GPSPRHRNTGGKSAGGRQRYGFSRGLTAERLRRSGHSMMQQIAFSDGAAARERVSKAEFARRIGRSKAAVSGYIKDGKLSGAALVPSDRGEMIDVTEALAQLGRSLDPVQRVAQPPRQGQPAGA